VLPGRSEEKGVPDSKRSLEDHRDKTPEAHFLSHNQKGRAQKYRTGTASTKKEKW